MTGHKWLVTALAMVTASPSLSQEWVPSRDIASAELAFLGWELKGSSAMTMPDGRHAVITFWSGAGSDEGEEVITTIRCISLFDAKLQQSSEVCAQPGNARN